MKQLRKKLVSVMIAAAVLFGLIPVAPEMIRAAAGDTHTVTVMDLKTSTVTATTTVTEGASGASYTLPGAATILYIDGDNFKTVGTGGTTVNGITTDRTFCSVDTTDATIPQGTITFVSGTGNWFIINGKLYVTGNGTINVASDTNTFGITYQSTAADISVEQPSHAYAWLTPTTVGDEKTIGWGNEDIPTTPRTVSISSTGSETVTETAQKQGAVVQAPTCAPWIANAATITDAIFGSDVKLSGNMSLYFNANAASVPSSLSGIKDSVYTALKNIYLYADTSGITYATGMFAKCPALENVFVDATTGFDLTACENAGFLFYGDKKLKSDAPNSALKNIKTTAALKTLRYAFTGDSALTGINFANFNTSNVKDMYFTWAGCTNLGLTQTDIDQIDFANTEILMGTFCGADIDTSLPNPLANIWGAAPATSKVLSGAIDLHLKDMTKVKSMCLGFAMNPNLTSINMTGMAMDALEDATAAFAFDNGLAGNSAVKFGGLETPVLKNIPLMFFKAGAENAKAEFTSWNIGEITDGRYAFYGTGFQTIGMNGTNPTKLEKGEGMFANNVNLTSLGDSNLAQWRLNELLNGSYMFNGDASLATLDLSSWTLPKATNLSYFISDCEALGVVDLSSMSFATVENMDCFMNGCVRVTVLNLSSKPFTALTRAYRAFADLDQLQTIDLTGTNFPSLTIANGMFALCESLPSITISGTSPAITDAAGMFYADSGATTFTVPNIFASTTTNGSYAFCGCSNATDIVLTNANTTAMAYMQGMFDHDTKLRVLTIPATFTTSHATDTGRMFRECSALTDTTLKAFLTTNFDPAELLDAYEMMYNTANLTEADLSGKNFTKMNDATRMFYNATSTDLAKIILPETFLKGVTNPTDNAQNVFYVPTLTLTDLYIKADTIPAYLASYNWTGDNRTFLSPGLQTINGINRSSYKLTGTTDTAAMKYPVTSSLYKGSATKTAVAPSFAWQKNSVSFTNNADNYTTNQAATYKITASLEPLALSDAKSATFTITDRGNITSISAKYTGGKILVNDTYQKANVMVTLSYDDGTTRVLDPAEFTVNSQVVTQVGDNEFMATYTEGGTSYPATFKVPGYKKLGLFEIAYNGPSVIVGQKYDTKYITAKAYYEDDLSKTNGIIVTPTSYSTSTVDAVGDNTITGYYRDPNTGNMLSGTFKVTGYNKTPKSVKVEYTGPDIVVGNNYDTANVTMEVTYDDNTVVKTKDFAVNSQLVNVEGANTFTATLKGTTLSGTFTVRGISTAEAEKRAANAANTKYNGGGIPGSGANGGSGGTGSGTGSTPKTGDDNPIALIILIMILAGAALAGLLVYKKKRI